jgi:hypothetical protein
MLPPLWAESLLRMLLAAKDRDSVSGDLLEEYRESIVPAVGAGADRWFVRQVAGYVLRAIWMWSVLVAAICLWRYLLDTLAPIHYTRGVVALRSEVMSWGLAGTFFGCGAWHTWRTRNPITGLLLALATASIGGLLTILVTGVSLAIRHDPATMAAIAGSGGIDELWAIPLLLQPLAALVTGSAGALVGLAAGAIYDWSSPNTKSA